MASTFPDMMGARAEATGPPPPLDPDGRGERFGRLLVFGTGDIDTAPPRDYLLKGVISQNEVSLWVGPPKCGKSFLLLYVAYMLSLGRSVFGRRVKSTKVLYVAAEGEAGIAKRLRALRDRYGPSDNFRWIAQPIDLLHGDGHKSEVIDAATACGSQLVIIDTLNRAMAGGNENASDDMGTLITNVAAIRCHTSAHIAIIHHPAKNGSGSRGHGSLEGADDALIDVQKIEGTSDRVATLVHSKDDADGMKWGFKLEVVEQGDDDDGDPITTLIVVESAEAATEVKAPRLSNNEQIALATFDKAMTAGGILATVGPDFTERPVITDAIWRSWFFREGKPGEDPETKRRAFTRARDGLLAKGRIATQDDYIWRPEVW